MTYLIYRVLNRVLYIDHIALAIVSSWGLSICGRYVRSTVYSQIFTNIDRKGTCFSKITAQTRRPVWQIYGSYVYIVGLLRTFVLDLMSAAMNPQVFIIWGSQGPSTKYALALCRYALSYTRDPFFQLQSSVFIEFVLSPSSTFSKTTYLPQK